jgi:hypothetical protein
MKSRTGFVSNSSSSSFIIATRDELKEKELAKKILNNTFGEYKKNSIFGNLSKEISDFIASEYLREIEVTDADDFGGTEEDFEITKTRFPYMFIGFADSDGCESYESILCDLEINYQDDEIFIKKEAGY